MDKERWIWVPCFSWVDFGLWTLRIAKGAMPSGNGAAVLCSNVALICIKEYTLNCRSAGVCRQSAAILHCCSGSPVGTIKPSDSAFHIDGDLWRPQINQRKEDKRGCAVNCDAAAAVSSSLTNSRMQWKTLQSEMCPLGVAVSSWKYPNIVNLTSWGTWGNLSVRAGSAQF